MPTYEYRCLKCEKLSTAYRTVDTRNNCPQCSCGAETEKIISAPSMVMPDIREYKAMAGGAKWFGKPITSRAQHREYLRSNDLTEVGNG
jgi:putative FmdB family regulatory protein